VAIRKIILPLTPGSELGPVLRGAFDVAESLSAHLDVIFIRPDAETTFVYTGMVPSELIEKDLRAKLNETGKAEANRLHRQFNRLSREAGLRKVKTPARESNASVRWREIKGEPSMKLPSVARNADLALFAGAISPFDMVFGTLLETALLRSGIPVLFLPEIETPIDWSNPLLAWDGSTACARAISAWLSIETRSKRASILHVVDPGEDPPDLAAVADRLAWHGVEASKVVRERHLDSIGKTLLTAAEDMNCGLIVMGGYGRFRYSEALFGGVTRHVIRKSSIPVLMVH